MKLKERKHKVVESEHYDEVDHLNELLIAMINNTDDDINELYYIPMQELLQTYKNSEIDWDYLEEDFNRSYYYLAVYILEPKEVVKHIKNIKFDGNNIERTINDKDSRDIIRRITKRDIEFLTPLIENSKYYAEDLDKYFLKDK